MKVAVLIKNNEISSYPADLLIDGEVIKSFNIEFELEANKFNRKVITECFNKTLKRKRNYFFKS